MGFEWDPAKAESNRLKHGVGFAEASMVFDDDAKLMIEDENEDEERFIVVGMSDQGRVLVVVYAWREENIRIISARKATTREREQYEEGI